jgi:hypothetical protein
LPKNGRRDPIASPIRNAHPALGRPVHRLAQGRRVDLELVGRQPGSVRLRGSSQAQHPCVADRAGLRTPEGIGVGSTFDDLSDAYGERFQFFRCPDDASGVTSPPRAQDPAGANLSLMELGGPIVGIGSTIKFC